MIEKQTPHNPVLLKEVMELIPAQPNATYIDATFGAGGYSNAILSNNPECEVIAFDHDTRVNKYTILVEEKYKQRFLFINDNFANMSKYIELFRNKSIYSIVFDVGVSSMQLDNADFGFSFLVDGPLDMRMNKRSEVTAESIVNNYSEEQLSNIIFSYGGERKAKQIAHEIIKEREKERIISTRQLVKVIKTAVKTYNDTIHPATRTFQALRIEVNDELNSLKQGLLSACHLLSPEGTLIVVSFHSLEDKIVKDFFKNLTQQHQQTELILNSETQNISDKTFEIINKKPLVPTKAEIRNNPRSRSAKLRAIRRVK